jgi:hypothetical protein
MVLPVSSQIWLLLSYKVPREPSARRVYVWRKLKKLGAAALGDSVWALPSAPHIREQFRWLASEIEEMGGETTLWEARLLDGTGKRLMDEISAPVEDAYRAILKALLRKSPDLTELSRRYQEALSRDYFGSVLARKVRKGLLAAKGENQR